jgi:hypothetical protein
MTEMLSKPADKLDELGDRAAEQGGVVAKAAEDLHADADFLRRLDPRREPDGASEPGSQLLRATPSRSGGKKPAADKRSRRALIVIGGAFLAGLAVAAFLQWRSLVEPRH